MKKWTFEEVKKVVSGTSECKLLSTSADYKNSNTKIKFECKCGNIFETTFEKFRLRDKKQCNSCGFSKGQTKRLKIEDVREFIEIKSNSGCTLVSKEYKNSQEKLDLLCKCGNPFSTKWSHFRNSFQRQCKECGAEIRAKKRRLPLVEVENVIRSKGCELISEYKNCDDKIKIKCGCGSYFYTSFALFRDHDVNCCASCRSLTNTKSSKGEKKIRDWLDLHKIDYREEYTFPDLKVMNKLRFDFAIFNPVGKLKLLIEFDGKQHFGVGIFSDDTDDMLKKFLTITENDRIKNEFCFENAIPLLRISYKKYSKINDILSNSLL